MSSAQATGGFERNDPYAPTPDNRPVPLERSPLELTRETGTQMSFGERAAVEGILAQLRPRLALEIGTAAGGTLARIVRYSSEVHSIDISHEELGAAVGENIHLHTGSSHELLRPLLESFAEAGRSVDFALVDGDHSFEGVGADVRALLASPTVARTVILVHDSMNEEIRAGLEDVGLEAYEKVTYYEPDFVPGYVYRAGSARHAVWGGLALIICDTARSPGYSRSVRQWRYYEPYEAIHWLRARMRRREP